MNADPIVTTGLNGSIEVALIDAYLGYTPKFRWRMRFVAWQIAERRRRREQNA